MKSISYKVNADPFPQSSGDKHIAIIATIAVIGFLAIAGGLWFAISNFKKPSDTLASQNNANSELPPPTPSTSITTGDTIARPGFVDLARETSAFLTNSDAASGQPTGVNGQTNTNSVSNANTAATNSSTPSTNGSGPKTNTNSHTGTPTTNTNTGGTNNSNTNTSNTNSGNTNVNQTPPTGGATNTNTSNTNTNTNSNTNSENPPPPPPPAEPICTTNTNQVVLLQHTNECQ